MRSKPVLLLLAAALGLAWGLLRLWHFHTDMQFKAMVPDQGTGSGFFWQIKRKHERLATFAHWQNDASVFVADRLRRPKNWVKAFRAPGVLHLTWYGFRSIAERC